MIPTVKILIVFVLPTTTTKIFTNTIQQIEKDKKKSRKKIGKNK